MPVIFRGSLPSEYSIRDKVTCPGFTPHLCPLAGPKTQGESPPYNGSDTKSGFLTIVVAVNGILYIQDQLPFSLKGQSVNILNFSGLMVFVSTTWLCCRENSHREHVNDGCDCILIKNCIKTGSKSALVCRLGL